MDGVAEQIESEPPALGKDDGPLNHVFERSDVAGPVVDRDIPARHLISGRLSRAQARRSK